MSYKIVEVKFLGTNDKTYFFRTRLSLEIGKWYDIYTKESGGYSSPIKVVKEHPTTVYLYDSGMYKEIISATEVCLYAKVDKTKHSSIESNSPKDGYIDQVWFNPAKGTTVVRWIDGSKTMVRCQEGEPFDKEKGLALCYMKRTLGNKGNFNETLKKWCPIEAIEEVKEQKPNTKTVPKTIFQTNNFIIKDRTDELEEKVESMGESIKQIEAGLNRPKETEFCVKQIDLSQLIEHIFPCTYVKGE